MRANIDRSPLFNGQIRGIGPRYCPSLEDKIIRFPDKERHQIFLEPEGVEAREIYVNGFSMSLARDVQTDLVHALPGLEDAVLLRPGYAVESISFSRPSDATARNETGRRTVLAGQITDIGIRGGGAGPLPASTPGSRARERAIARIRVPARQAYIGILVDDLITKDVSAIPDVHITAKSAALAIDNADLRLTAKGHAAGLVGDDRWDCFVARRDRFEGNLQRLDRTLVRADSGDRVPASQLLRRPEVRLEQLMANGSVQLDIDRAGESFDLASVETTVKYAGYLKRQESEIERAHRNERRGIPHDFPFDRVPGLSREVVQRLSQVRPDVGACAAYPGVTPAAVAVLSLYVGRQWVNET